MGQVAHASQNREQQGLKMKNLAPAIVNDKAPKPSKLKRRTRLKAGFPLLSRESTDKDTDQVSEGVKLSEFDDADDQDGHSMCNLWSQCSQRSLISGGWDPMLDSQQ